MEHICVPDKSVFVNLSRYVYSVKIKLKSFVGKFVEILSI